MDREMSKLGFDTTGDGGYIWGSPDEEQCGDALLVANIILNPRDDKGGWTLSVWFTKANDDAGYGQYIASEEGQYESPMAAAEEAMFLLREAVTRLLLSIPQY